MYEINRTMRKLEDFLRERQCSQALAKDSGRLVLENIIIDLMVRCERNARQEGYAQGLADGLAEGLAPQPDPEAALAVWKGIHEQVVGPGRHGEIWGLGPKPEGSGSFGIQFGNHRYEVTVRDKGPVTEE